MELPSLSLHFSLRIGAYKMELCFKLCAPVDRKISAKVIRLHPLRSSGENWATGGRNTAIAALRAPACLITSLLRWASLLCSRPKIHVAGLGLTQWSESEQTVTKFMRWRDAGGLQFAHRGLFQGSSLGSGRSPIKIGQATRP